MRQLLTWKNEGEAGPIRVYGADKRQENGLPTMRPYDPNRLPEPWLTRAEALKLAASLNADFMEV